MRSPVRSLLVVPFLLSCGTPPPVAADREGEELRRIILAQAARHPLMQPADLYKLLHQAAMGSGHAIDDRTGAKRWMDREVSVMGVAHPDPMVDTIAPGGAVVLVNLRPWVAGGRSTDSLLDAFVATANAIPPDTQKLARYLRVGDSLAGQGRLPFSVTAWRDLVTGLRRGGFPAVHHSPEYESAYRPAYRVVKGELVP
jgi:hypothetical protein